MNYGRYQIIKELGKGSMGMVYQAHDPNLDVMVALKVLRPDRLVSEPFIKRFLAEARALGRLDHANIVRVYNVDEDGGTVYIAMEYIEGEPLNEVMQKKQMNPEEIIRLGIGMAETLNYAHQKGIVHRDIKPSNILIRADNQPKITDFGIAHVEDPAGQQQTQAGEILGTPAYMSPEQVMSRPVDGRSDLFSLGIILYEMCTGKRPFSGDGLPAVFNAITHLSPPEPSRLNPQVPKGFSQIIMKCLMKNPDERFQTGRSLAEALAGCLGKKETGTTGPQADKKMSRTTLFIALGATGVLILAIVVGLLFSHIAKSKKVESPGIEATTPLNEKIIGTSINVESTPPGADVFIDGISKGTAPLKLKVPAGKYEVKLSMDDYYDWEAQVQVHEGGETPLFVHLIPVDEKR